MSRINGPVIVIAVENEKSTTKTNTIASIALSAKNTFNNLEISLNIRL